MKKLLLLVIFFCISCSYKPIYSTGDKLDFEFKKIIINGDEKIKRQIINNLNINESFNSKRELSINITYKIEETSRNSRGEVETYRSMIIAEISINEDKTTLKKEKFLSQLSYKNKDNRYELRSYQQLIKNDLVDKLLSEIILFLKIT